MVVFNKMEQTPHCKMADELPNDEDLLAKTSCVHFNAQQYLNMTKLLSIEKYYI